jgi:hypothetical protein
MSDDLLARAARALRDEHGGTSDEAPDTELRVLATIRRDAARKRRLTAALPLLAALVASTAWAAETGRLAPLVQLVEGALGLGRPAPTPRGRPAAATNPEAPSLPRGPSSAESDPRTTTDMPETRDGLPPEPSAPAPSTRTSSPARTLLHDAGVVRMPSSRSASPQDPGAPGARSSAVSSSGAPPADPDALYRAAHEAHFVRKDPAVALAAWDRYLASAPAGALAVEARYNRAITLVRLGRTAEAIAQLRPFADGDYGPYRRAEARALVDALTSRAVK